MRVLAQEIISRHPEQYRIKLVPAAAPHEAPFLHHYRDLDPDRHAFSLGRALQRKRNLCKTAQLERHAEPWPAVIHPAADAGFYPDP